VFQPDCPKCGSALEVLGQGTERVEEVLAATFPGVPIARMDADTTTERGSHARILERFRSGDARLLVGTQIVAKGHDFPDVHVAAVLGCDHILGMPDFRSAERCFSLVTQLCGRAGRGDVPGEVFLQTTHPDHPVFACIGDMAAFSEHESGIRRMLRYPPFSRLILLRCEGIEREATLTAASALAALVRRQCTAGVDVLGPAFAALPKLVGRYRVQVVLRGRELSALRRLVTQYHTTWTTPHGVRLVVDVDPRAVA
jgi:primosomal protein N' (replication factor Y)